MIRSAVVVGAGFSGLAAGIALRREGVGEVTILERADGVGGVWEQNTYPGAACDVPSHLYSFSFAPNPRWQRRFARQPEIRAYLQDIARRFDLIDSIRCGVEATSAEWDDASCEWSVQTTAGEFRAQLLIAGCGQLTHPAIPEVENLCAFAGPVFHSSRWRHDLDLRGKRVGVIGTGASAIQFVPAVQPEVESLTLFQRTPPWILPKFDTPYRPLAQALFESAPTLQQAGRLAWWTFMEAAIAGFIGHPELLAPLEAGSRSHLRRQVPDRALRSRLTPDYRIGCKRVLLSSDWYPAISQPNVELVTEPLGSATATGVGLADGSSRELDVLIFGTGFEAREFVAPMSVVGHDGLTLDEAWNGLPVAWHGLTVPEFPNMFLMYGPNTFGGSGSAVYMIESQARHLSAAARSMRDAGASTIEVRTDAFERFVTELRERQKRTIWATGGCTSWYLDDAGRDPTNWPGYTIEYRKRTSRIDPAVYQLGHNCVTPAAAGAS